MDKITFLVGAGASDSTVPLISGFADGIKYLGEEMLKHRMAIQNRFPPAQQEFINNMTEKFLKDCTNFEAQTRSHSSIDTYAFKLFHTGKAVEFNRLKVIISSVIIYTTSRNPVNTRYDTFYSKILGRKPNEFKNDYRIISWNYDYIFEKAYSSYSGDLSLKKNQQLLNVNSYGLAGNQSGGSFKLLKINGTTSFYSNFESRETNILDDLELKDPEEVFFRIINMYSRSTWGYDEYRCGLTFAFEQEIDSAEDHILKKAIIEIQGTKALIIIGYSFPHINKDIDYEILEAAFPNLQKIYIQSKESKSDIMGKMISINRKYYPELFEQRDIYEFYVPYERF